MRFIIAFMFFGLVALHAGGTNGLRRIKRVPNGCISEKINQDFAVLHDPKHNQKTVAAPIEPIIDPNEKFINLTFIDMGMNVLDSAHKSDTQTAHANLHENVGQVTVAKASKKEVNNVEPLTSAQLANGAKSLTTITQHTKESDKRSKENNAHAKNDGDGHVTENLNFYENLIGSTNIDDGNGELKELDDQHNQATKHDETNTKDNKVAQLVIKSFSTDDNGKPIEHNVYTINSLFPLKDKKSNAKTMDNEFNLDEQQQQQQQQQQKQKHDKNVENNAVPKYVSNLFDILGQQLVKESKTKEDIDNKETASCSIINKNENKLHEQIEGGHEQTHSGEHHAKSEQKQHGKSTALGAHVPLSKLTPGDSIVKFANMLLYKLDGSPIHAQGAQISFAPNAFPTNIVNGDAEEFDPMDYLYNALDANNLGAAIEQTQMHGLTLPSGATGTSRSLHLLKPLPYAAMNDVAPQPINFLENALDMILANSINNPLLDDRADDDFEIRCPKHRDLKKKSSEHTQDYEDIYQNANDYDNNENEMVCSCHLVKKKH